MKHLFVIGSHTPYLTTLGVIEKANLKKEEIILILGRNYKCFKKIEGVTSYDLSDIYYIYLKNNTRKRIIDRVKQIDQFISEKIGESYTLYIPHLAFYFFQILATNTLCQDIKFIQEGIADFCVPENRFRLPSLKQLYVNNFIMNFGRTWEGKGWNDYKYNVKHASETFANNGKLFSEMDCKHTVIRWPILELPVKYNPNGTFFVFESLVEQKNIEPDIFFQATDKLINKFAGEINYIKFHPYQKEENIDMIKALFAKHGAAYEVMSSDIPFEMVLASLKRMKVCGFTTSLVFFAALMPQHEAHICAPALYSSGYFLKKYWKEYSGFISRCYGDTFIYDSLD